MRGVHFGKRAAGDSGQIHVSFAHQHRRSTDANIAVTRPNMGLLRAARCRRPQPRRSFNDTSPLHLNSLLDHQRRILRRQSVMHEICDCAARCRAVAGSSPL